MVVGSFCKAFEPSKPIKTNRFFNPITPEWCPLKKEPIVIELLLSKK
jgi:hypothetical protein